MSPEYGFGSAGDGYKVRGLERRLVTRLLGYTCVHTCAETYGTVQPVLIVLLPPLFILVTAPITVVSLTVQQLAPNLPRIFQLSSNIQRCFLDCHCRTLVICLRMCLWFPFMYSSQIGPDMSLWCEVELLEFEPPMPRLPPPQSAVEREKQRMEDARRFTEGAPSTGNHTHTCRRFGATVISSAHPANVHGFDCSVNGG